MMRRTPARRVAVPIGERLYAALLRAYPAGFRAEHGPEMLAFFRARRQEPRHAGALGALRLWLHIGRDLGASTPAERARALRDALSGRRRAHPCRSDPHSSGDVMSTLVQDFRYALRTLRVRPGFTVVAVLTLALGIGANAAIFSLVNEMLLRPLPYPAPDRMVTLWSMHEGERAGVSYPDLVDIARESRSIAAIGLLVGQTVNYTGGETPDRLRGGFATAGFFDVVGVQPALGRLFSEAEAEPGHAARVVVLAEHVWRTRFGRDPAILGRVLQLNGQPVEVIGVLPAGFRSPWDEPDVYLPFGLHTSRGAFDRGARNLPALARLEPGVQLVDARAELAVIATRLATAYPESNDGRGADLEPLQRTLTSDVRPALLTLFAVVGLVLLIACANVANLLLARAAARRREMSLRAALGAGRRRLVRQLLTESLVLASAGALTGLVVAHFGLRALLAMMPSDFIIFRNVGVDGGVLVFTLLLATACGLLFGLAPALHASRANLQGSLVTRGTSAGRASGRAGLRGLFVVAQVALAIVLLVAAGLLTRSLVGLHRVSPGFDPRSVLTMEFRLPATKYAEPERQAAFMAAAVAELRRVPGVREAALVRAAPFSYNGGAEGYVVEGREPAPGAEPPLTQINTVTPGYFATIGIPLRAGRDVSESDRADAPIVVVVSEELARRAWPGESPLGKRLRPAEGGPWITVVGVVGNTRHYGLNDEIAPQAYVAFAQMPGIFATVVARTEGDPLALAPAVRDAIWAVDPDQPVWKIRTMEQMIDASLGSQRLTMRLVLGFATLALLLAGIGIYGVMSFAVEQRTQEVGVRMALGAQRREVVGLVVRQGLMLTLVATLLGLAGAFAAATLLASQLHGVSTHDPATFVIVPLVLGAVALLAMLVPAWRASRLDPMVALRHD